MAGKIEQMIKDSEEVGCQAMAMVIVQLENMIYQLQTSTRYKRRGQGSQ